MKELLKKVAEFQKATEQTINNKLTFINRKEEYLRYELMQEENKEYKDACLIGSELELLDALVDKMYILLGTINSHGAQSIFLEAFNRVHENNMTKVVNGKVLRNSEGKILKPKGFKPVDLTDLI